jgi:lycopene beta-cyclase
LKLDSDLFVPGEATLMDLRVGQDEGVVFVYIMPFSASKALIEYTVFSKDLLSSQEYDDRLKKYINEFTGIKSYNILEEEFGIIPMTDQEFMLSEHHIINIGTAGGQTKASSGFTFKFIQEHSAAIIKKLSGNKYPVVRPARKFRYYDSIFWRRCSKKKFLAERFSPTCSKKTNLNSY